MPFFDASAVILQSENKFAKQFPGPLPSPQGDWLKASYTMNEIMLSPDTMYEDGTYLKNNPTWHAEDSPWKAKQITKILNKNSISPASICEIGCGAGDILKCLANEYGPDVVFSGYEISPQAFDICRRKENQNLHFFLKDLLEQEGLLFDVVMAIDVFEHIEDYFGFLRQLKDKGTYKIFHIPLDISVLTVLCAFHKLKCRSVTGHIHYFTKETALATLKDIGYEVIDYFYTRNTLELPSNNWKVNLLNLPRRLFFPLHQDLTVRILGGFSLLVLAK